jgi:hypothetical protein
VIFASGAAPLLPASCDEHLSVFIPECIPSVGFDIGSQVENPLSAFGGTAHAAATQSGLDQRFTGGLHGSASDGKAATAEIAIGHPGLVAPEEGALGFGVRACQFPISPIRRSRSRR